MDSGSLLMDHREGFKCSPSPCMCTYVSENGIYKNSRTYLNIKQLLADFEATLFLRTDTWETGLNLLCF